ncbi:MAG: secretion protein [Proteobacteria bacterium]|nr:secretion protein [Pseudomonadota bacterium]
MAGPQGEKPEAQQRFLDALANVYMTHPQLFAQRESLKATDETVNQAVSGFRPDVRANYSKGRVNTRQENGAQTETRSFNVTQPVFDGLSTVSNYKGARDRVEAAQANLTALEQQVLLDGITAYTNVVNSMAVLQVNQNNVDLLNRQYLATKSRFDVGEVTRTDTAQAQTRLEIAKASERQVLGTLDADRATFRRIIGFDAPQDLTLPAIPGGLPATLEEALVIATTNEPTLAAAQELESARLNDLNALKGAILPSVNLTGGVRRVQNTVGGSQSVSNDSIQLNFIVPLYQSGAEWSRVRQAKHLAAQAKFNAMDTRNAVVESVTRAWQLYVAAREVIKSSESAVDAAKTAMQSIRQESKFGVRTILDVLNTQQDMFNAQVSLVNARVTERLTAYRLLASVGRLTAKDLGLRVDVYDPNQHYDKVKYKLIGF